MALIWTLLIGLVVGIMAKLVMPGRDPGGFILTTLLGIAGAYVAYFIGRAAGWYTEGEPTGFIASVLGAVALLALYRLVAGRPARVTDRTS
ncbi:MAG: GlsB/YeaQ/YmgE family stress response membrane protein [Verrucomicrobiota bacterium]